ncbi:MAG: hypothetical protein ABUS47_04235 [Steroidobacter sp.]
MGFFDKNQDKHDAFSGNRRDAARSRIRASAETGKTIYNQHTSFEWNTTYVKSHSLRSRRVQSNGLDPDELGDTISLIKLEEESALQPGYNPYDSGLSAMKQSRKPPALQELSKHNTHLRKFGKHK